MGRERGLLIVEIVEVRYDKGEGMGGEGDGGWRWGVRGVWRWGVGGGIGGLSYVDGG